MFFLCFLYENTISHQDMNIVSSDPSQRRPLKLSRRMEAVALHAPCRLFLQGEGEVGIGCSGSNLRISPFYPEAKERE